VPLNALKAAAHNAGVRAIFNAWQSYKTSTTGELYPVYYGSAWDRANPTPEAAGDGEQKDEAKKATAADPARLARLVSTLSLTQAGRDALSALTRHGVRVEFIQGSGAGYFSSAKNLIAIGDQKTDAVAVNTLLHELGHATTFHSGRAARRSMPRQSYVDAKILDEAEADARVARAAREYARINRRAGQGGSRVQVGEKSTTKLYLDAYKQVIFAGRAARQGT
jgi:hypothetical protein